MACRAFPHTRPVINGHEVSGTLGEVGDDVEGIQMHVRGSRVSADHLLRQLCGLSPRRSYRCLLIGTPGGNTMAAGRGSSTRFCSTRCPGMSTWMGSLVEPLAVKTPAARRPPSPRLYLWSTRPTWAQCGWPKVAPPSRPRRPSSHFSIPTPGGLRSPGAHIGRQRLVRPRKSSACTSRPCRPSIGTSPRAGILLAHRHLTNALSGRHHARPADGPGKSVTRVEPPRHQIRAPGIPALYA